jgi:hypothetical protein
MFAVKPILYALTIVCLLSNCTEDNDVVVPTDTLENYLADKKWQDEAVIACATSDTTAQELWTFFYPETGAKDIRLYETINSDADPSRFTNYSNTVLNSELVFNGYLRKFVTRPTIDKWLIVTLMLRDTIRVSNPIRTKRLTKPTEWGTSIAIDQNISGNPKFTWPDNTTGDNAIYFQVVADSLNNLISGTYTYENTFSYYDTSNVVLNITKNTPPPLNINKLYNFTLMDVSEDNWVNLATTVSFVGE